MYKSCKQVDGDISEPRHVYFSHLHQVDGIRSCCNEFDNCRHERHVSWARIVGCLECLIAFKFARQCVDAFDDSINIPSNLLAEMEVEAPRLSSL